MAVPLPDCVDHLALLALMADGEVHSGASLARELRWSRGEVGKGVARLRARGIPIASLTRRGYRLSGAVELLSAARINAALREDFRAKIHRLEIPFEVDSTNSRLLGSQPPPLNRADVCLCEIQIAGRGRRGRQWVSPFGDSIALSVGWTFEDARVHPTLSLAAGVAISRALERQGARDIRLKWPNDIWWCDRKIGGVLVELKTEAGGPAHAVIGVGLNLSLPDAARRELEASGARVAALTDACAAPVPRNELAAALLEELLSMLAEFERSGFAPFREPWRALDALSGRRARVLTGGSTVEGISRGVDVDGALLVESGGGLAKFVSGEVSLRLGAGDT